MSSLDNNLEPVQDPDVDQMIELINREFAKLNFETTSFCAVPSKTQPYSTDYRVTVYSFEDPTNSSTGKPFMSFEVDEYEKHFSEFFFDDGHRFQGNFKDRCFEALDVVMKRTGYKRVETNSKATSDPIYESDED